MGVALLLVLIFITNILFNWYGAVCMEVITYHISFRGIIILLKGDEIDPFNSDMLHYICILT
jgi:hypothetical protein